MKQNPDTAPVLPSRLNIGCGRQFRADWCNIDLIAMNQAVIQHDIRTGLPFPDGTFDAVYHSHVLEHLTPEQGQHLLQECLRVLRPGGRLRVVVPDLERIADLYLTMLQGAWDGDRQAQCNYEWITLELLDQLVRDRSGGRMGPYMIQADKTDQDFVRSRIGGEMESCEPHLKIHAGDYGRRTVKALPWRERWQHIRQSLARLGVRVLMGRDGLRGFEEGLFRQQGEVHRWMYDRYSLRELCHKTGFVDFHICRADESNIDDFANSELDSADGMTRKPDSLFVECRRPAIAASLPKAA